MSHMRSTIIKAIKKHDAEGQVRVGRGQASLSRDRKSKKGRTYQLAMGKEGAKNMIKGTMKKNRLAEQTQN